LFFRRTFEPDPYERQRKLQRWGVVSSTEEYLTLYKQINVLLASNRMYQRNDSTGANQGNSLPLFTSNTKEMPPCQRRHNTCYQQQFGSSKVRGKKVHVHAWSACCNGQNHA